MAFKLENNPLFQAEQPKNETPKAPKKQGSAKKNGKKDTAAEVTAEKPKMAGTAVQKPKKGRSADVSQQREAAEYVRATFIVRRDLLETLKDYAFTEREDIKTVINEILEDALESVKAEYAASGKTLISRK